MDENHKPMDDLPPDIILDTLPFLSVDDIKNLSLTNKYYNKLLDHKDSDTLWHEIFHKSYGTPLTNDEPFQSKKALPFNSCSEQIMSTAFPSKSWLERYQLRSKRGRLYTWGSVKHARLGYTAASNSHINTRRHSDADIEPDRNDIHLTNNWNPSHMGVCRPTAVPWYPPDDNSDDSVIVQISGGGFSFQILTKSGKIFLTGATFTGGHKGPGPREGERDYNQFREYIRLLESNLARNSYPDRLHDVAHSINTQTNIFGQFRTGIIPPHVPRRTIDAENSQINMYESLEQLERNITEIIPGNPHLTRMYPKDSLPLFDPENSIDINVDHKRLNSIKFKAISSGRSHFLALSNLGDIYTWDNPESNGGIKIKFKDLPGKETNPILKIACGWNFNCIYQYKIGLVAWKEREALKEKETSAFANYEKIPNTSDMVGDKKVIDFTCLSDCVVYYIDSEGEFLYQYMNKIVKKLKTPLTKKLYKVISCYNLILLFSDKECYSFKLDGNNIQLNTMKEIQLEDKDDTIISLSGGDYHTLALTKKGQIYVWGTESQMCGCLGLGKYDRQQWGYIRGINNLIVDRPTKIDVGEGNICVAVTSGGWQSGAIIMNEF